MQKYPDLLRLDEIVTLSSFGAASQKTPEIDAAFLRFLVDDMKQRPDPLEVNNAESAR